MMKFEVGLSLTLLCFPRQVARLADLEEFQKHKEQLMSNLETMEKQQANQKEEHEAAIHSLEMEVLMEKQRLSWLVTKIVISGLIAF